MAGSAGADRAGVPGSGRRPGPRPGPGAGPGPRGRARRSGPRSVVAPATSGRAARALACSITNGAFMLKRACWGTVVRGRRSADWSGLAKSKARNTAGQALAIHHAVDGPPPVLGIAGHVHRPAAHPGDRAGPTTNSSVSRIASRSSRRRGNRQSSRFSGSTLRQSGRSKLGLLVGARQHDQAVQRLERPALVLEPGGQVVEQLGMAGRRAAGAEVAGGRHQRLAEVVHPDAVDDDPAGERIVGRRDRPGQVEPAAAVRERPAIRRRPGPAGTAGARDRPAGTGCPARRSAARTARRRRSSTIARGQGVGGLHGHPVELGQLAAEGVLLAARHVVIGLALGEIGRALAGRPGSRGSAGGPGPPATRRDRRRRFPGLLVDPADQLAVGPGDVGPGLQVGAGAAASATSGFNWPGCVPDGRVRQRARTAPAFAAKSASASAIRSCHGPKTGSSGWDRSLMNRRHRATICGRRSSGASERKKIAVSSGSGGVVAARTR